MFLGNTMVRCQEFANEDSHDASVMIYSLSTRQEVGVRAEGNQAEEYRFKTSKNRLDELVMNKWDVYMYQHVFDDTSYVPEEVKTKLSENYQGDDEAIGKGSIKLH